ncbi:MAG: macro domain-containing protein [Clostridia bacterium]|nr:macro domain-containing protein [Clostridia bacterium]
MPFSIVRNDITRVRADAIVNTANPQPVIGRGTDSAIYAAAGEEKLLAERRRIGTIEPGQAAATPAFDLNAKYIIHTVGPAWIDGGHGERETLQSCYRSSMALAASLECASIAFPLIATGIYGFPKDEALNIALAEIGRFLLTHEMHVTLVVFDRRALELSEDLIGGIEQYIDEHAAQAIRAEEYGLGDGDERGRRALLRERERERSARLMNNRADAAASQAAAPMPPLSGRDLDAVLGEPGKSFRQRLFELIDASGMDEVTVYKKANIDRKVFSRIRSKHDYRPTKRTAVAFAIALQLDLATTRDLLSRAEIALSPSSRFDLIVSYFITNRNYNIYELNTALFSYGLPTLDE